MKSIVVLLTVLGLVFAGLTVKHSHNEDYGEIVVLKSERSINLSGDNPEETNKLTIVNTESRSLFYYHIVPADLVETLAEIKFQFRKTTLSHTVEQLKDGGLLYIVSLGEHLDENPRQISVSLSYTPRRYRNLPRAISLNEDQLLEYTDYLSFYSPYIVNSQTSTYKFQKVVEYSSGGEKSGLSSVKFASSSVKPFSQEKISVHGLNNKAQVVFTKVEKTIEISYWGNLAISEKYSIVNTGPELKGEFSRVEFNEYNPNAGKNAWKGMTTKLPVETWGLFYRDEVGNITTSRAYKDSRAEAVIFSMVPRFGLLGGWKSNWEIGYNLPTTPFLAHRGSQFETKFLNFGYELDSVLAESYTVKIILPEGATNPKVVLDSKQLPFQQTTTFSYLDFEGRPTLILKRGITGRDIQKDVKITYDYETKALLRKPFLVFSAIFGLLSLFIVAGRLELKTISLDSY